MNSKDSKIVSKVISTKTISTIKELKTIIAYWKENVFSYEDLEPFISVLKIDLPIKTVSKEEIIKTMLQDSKKSLTDFIYKDIVLYNDEIEYLKTCTNNEVRKLLYSFLIYSKLYPHESNWIKYDKDAIFELSGLECSDNKRVLLFSDCLKYKIDLTVIGSKNPIICFKFMFPQDDNRVVFREVEYGENINNLYNSIFGEENE